MDLAKFVDKHTQLVERERLAEHDEARALASRLRPTHLQRLGLALAALRITQTRTGLGGRLVLTLEAPVAGAALAPTSLRVGDIVGMQSAGASNGSEQLGGVIWRLSDTKLTVALNSADAQVPPEWHERCTVVKLASDVTHTRVLRALRDLKDLPKPPPLHAVLFDKEEPRFDKVSLDPFDPSLDPSQRQAVELAVGALDIALVHGPPGTGKTHTLVEIVRQLVSREQRLLVCAPSNVAVDNLVERLARLRKLHLLRLGHPARVLPAAAPYSLAHQAHSCEEGVLARDVAREIDQLLARLPKCKRAGERREIYANVKELRKEYRQREARAVARTVANSQVVLSTLSGAASRDLSNVKFDVVIIDEATQALEGECWIAALQAPKLILAGDHHQLPPTVKSQSSDALELSLFERVRSSLGAHVCCMLTTQYRMHELIMRVSSDRLYDGLLRAHSSVASHLLCDLSHVELTDDTVAPLVYIDTSDSAMLESAETDLQTTLADQDSKLNRGEADLAAAHIEALLSAGLLPNEIAVISPYNAQVRLLKSLLRERHPEIEIGSVDGFQGREKEAVVLSLVRSNDDQEIGFLSDYRRINVAITRARRHLCVIANGRTVAMRDPFLKALVSHLEEAAELRFP